jgi:hypothetical protein
MRTTMGREDETMGERTIVVDDRLRTSDPAISCVGESALHRDTIYGLVEVETGEGLSDASYRVRTPVELRGEEVWVLLPPIAASARGGCPSTAAHAA